MWTHVGHAVLRESSMRVSQSQSPCANHQNLPLSSGEDGIGIFLCYAHCRRLGCGRHATGSLGGRVMISRGAHQSLKRPSDLRH